MTRSTLIAGLAASLIGLGAAGQAHAVMQCQLLMSGKGGGKFKEVANAGRGMKFGDRVVKKNSSCRVCRLGGKYIASQKCAGGRYAAFQIFCKTNTGRTVGAMDPRWLPAKFNYATCLTVFDD